MKLRRSPRLPVQCPIAYSGINFAGVGTVSNLSTGGCKVGSFKPVDTRTYLKLRLYFTGYPELPMEVDQAQVRWSHEREFGLKFITMRPEERERLHRFVTSLGEGRSQYRPSILRGPIIAGR